MEAAAMLALVRTGLWAFPFPTLRRLLTPSPRSPLSPASPERIAWAVAAIARRFPRFLTCLVQALGTDVVLRRRGYPSELRVGVRKPADERPKPLQAHAWVVCQGRVVAGELPDLEGYVLLSAPGTS